MNTHISIKKSILYAVNSFISNPWYFVKLFLYWLAFSILLALGIVFFAFGLTYTFNTIFAGSIDKLIIFVLGNLLLLVLGIFVLIFLWFAPTKLLLKFYDEGPKSLSFAQLFSLFNLKTALRLFGAVILYQLIVVGGLLLLIVPGVYWAIKFQFVFYYIIDENMGVIEALRKSYASTTGNFWQLAGINIIAYFMNALILLLPVAYLMLIYAYKKLKTH